jgi:thymidylate synthase
MNVLEARNVEHAFHSGMFLLRDHGHLRPSRNGDVLVMDGPVTTTYHRPRERVLLNAARDANPFFHLMESLWMMAGRNDVAYVARLVPNMASFSDDGRFFNGAYGFRWRAFFGKDQLRKIAEALKANPECRRQVLAMWDGHHDFGLASKDLPCNTHAYFSIDLRGRLDMTVCNRSNDIVWGAYGANAVHFSFLQEVMAAWIGVPVGTYYQMSNNYHGYVSTVEKLLDEADTQPDPSYNLGLIEPYPIVNVPISTWLEDLSIFITAKENVVGYRDPFFRRVAVPMSMAYRAFKDNKGAEKYDKPLEILEQCAATDWRKAGQEWINRRYSKWQKRSDDGPAYE